MAKPIRPDPIVSAQARALVERTSMAEAARRLDLAEATVARIVAGLPVTPGSELLAKAGLEKIATEAA
jgi:hypothetical protein